MGGGTEGRKEDLSHRTNRGSGICVGFLYRSLPGNSRLLPVRPVRAKPPCSTSSADSIGRIAGEVWVAGQNLQLLSSGELAHLRLQRIGFVFQTYNLLPVLTALENAEFTLLLQGMPARKRRERVEKLFSEIGLAGLEDRRPAELSGGQQQRVAVARAMVTEPALILADEPTANLDSATAIALLDVMEHLNRATGTTFIFSTHDPQVMERAHRLIRLRDGQIASDETRSLRRGEGDRSCLRQDSHRPPQKN